MLTKNKNQGITLIALVVTIVVLLILAGISISMLTGDNGVITQSKNAKEATEQAKVEELVSVAIGSVISKNNGSTAGITPKMVADQINEDEKRTDVYAENETTFPTNIIFPKENRKAEANLNTGKFVAEENSIYSVDINEADIAPMNLFDYEIINNGETGALTLDSLPTKTVKITRIKPEYCNSWGYNPDTGNALDYTDTNYEIICNGTKIEGTLVIPYQVDGQYVTNGIKGELYKVVEADINVESMYGYQMPKVEKIIYPNTIKKIGGKRNGYNNPDYSNTTVKEIILPQNLKVLDDSAIYGCTNLSNIIIPNSVTSIGNYAFCACSGLTNIIIPKSVTSIGREAFYRCSSLTSITIPENVTSIGNDAFDECSGLTNIIIPKSVTSIGGGAFHRCSSLTSITIPEGVTGIEYSTFWGCSGLNSIKVAKENPNYDSRNDCNAIIETNTNKLIRGCNTTIIPENVTSIGSYAFNRCNGLTSITIPENVTSIENDAFDECSGLNSIKVAKENPNYDSRNDCNAIIKTSTNTLIRGCNTTIIPENVTSIGSEAFRGCRDLTIVTIPKSVTSIYDYAFYDCNKLTTINYVGTEEEWNNITIERGNYVLENVTINYNYSK